MLLCDTSRVPDTPIDIIDDMICVKKMIANNASQEGIISSTRNVIVGLHDFIAKIIVNQIRNVANIFRSVKRSDLRLTIDKNLLAYTRLSLASYTDIHKAVVPYYHFTKRPVEISAFCNTTFEQFDIGNRIDKITERFNRVKAYIKAGDFNEAEATIADIINLSNPVLTKANVDYWKDVVIVRIPKTSMLLGEVFQSTTEMTEAVRSVLYQSAKKLSSVSTIADSLANLKMSSSLDTLYKTLDGVAHELLTQKNAGADIARLDKLVIACSNTAELVESFASLIKEYMNLDHWISECIQSAIKKYNSI